MAVIDPIDQRSAAMDSLYRAHEADLLRLCRRRLGPGPDAEDAAHEAVLRAWRALPTLDPDRPVWPWLATIAGNVCIDVQRRRATARAYAPPAAGPVVGPEEAAVRHVHAPLVRDALDRLSPTGREALVLREVEDWDYARIARHQRRSAAAVRTAVTRARQELRSHLEDLARARDQWPLAGLTGGLVAKARIRRARAAAGWDHLVGRSAARLDGALEAVASAPFAAAAHAAVGGLLVLGPLAGPEAAPPAPPAAVAVVASSTEPPAGSAGPTASGGGATARSLPPPTSTPAAPDPAGTDAPALVPGGSPVAPAVEGPTPPPVDPMAHLGGVDLLTALDPPDDVAPPSPDAPDPAEPAAPPSGDPLAGVLPPPAP